LLSLLRKNFALARFVFGLTEIVLFSMNNDPKSIIL
jgi:hypothetical protein